MEPQFPVIDEEGLRQLEAFLCGASAPPGTMTLPTVDGLLSGLACAPNHVEVDIWLPLVWGDSEPGLDGSEANRFLDLLLGLMKSVVGRLEGEAPFAPLLRGEAEETALSSWCDGFLRGMNLDALGWRAMDMDGRRELLYPLLAVGASRRRSLSEAQRELVRRMFEEDALLPELAKAVPISVKAIYAIWVEARAGRGLVPEPYRRGFKVGRNDPCPCGSGKKYKKCCGGKKEES